MTEWQYDRQDKNNMPPDLRSRGHKNATSHGWRQQWRWKREGRWSWLFCQRWLPAELHNISEILFVQGGKAWLLFPLDSPLILHVQVSLLPVPETITTYNSSDKDTKLHVWLVLKSISEGCYNYNSNNF